MSQHRPERQRRSGQPKLSTRGNFTRSRGERGDRGQVRALESIQCFLDTACQEIGRGSLTANATKLKEDSRIPCCRWLRQVNGSRLEKTQIRQSQTSWGARRTHYTRGSSSIFRSPKNNSGISKRPFHGDYQERSATRSWCKHYSRLVTTQTPQSLWNESGNPDPRRPRARIDNCSREVKLRNFCPGTENKEWGYAISISGNTLQ